MNLPSEVAFETKFNLYLRDGTVVQKNNGSVQIRKWFVQRSVVKFRHPDGSSTLASALVTLAWREMYLPRLITDSP